MTDDTTTDDSSTDELDVQVLQAQVEALTKENEELQQALEENDPGNLKELAARAQADLQNAKERMNREADDIRRFALEKTIMGLLPTIDNFKRAFSHLPEDIADHDWVKGVQVVEQDLERTLTDMGVQRIDAVGSSVDPAVHETLQAGPGDEGVILEVFEEGYMLHDKVLRPAKVKVGDGTGE